MEHLYKRLYTILKNIKGNKQIEVIFIGRSAMPFYGIPSKTLDVDFEIRGLGEKEFFLLKEALDREGIIADFGEDISGWSVIPLPEGYRERARIVYEDEDIKFKVLDPVDFIVSKLRRGTDDDEEDALNLVRCLNIKAEDITARIGSLKLPKDLETFFFLKRINRFLNRLKEIK
jgi:hypothetical protein